VDTEKEVVLSDDENKLDIELSDLYAPNGKYTPEEKVAAVMSYVISGTSKKASRNLENQTGLKVPPDTIRWWKNSSIWWPDVYAEMKKKKQDELDGAFTSFIHTAIEGMEDRIKNGDHVVTKTGEIIRKPMSGKDIGWLMGVTFDKRQLLRGDPTSRVEKTSEGERLDKLEQLFMKMSNMQKEWNAKTIEGETK